MRPLNYSMKFAFDDSVRTYTPDGHLRIETSNISKANVCPYIGKEIPAFQELGLDPDKIYKLYRDPEELRKGAPTSNQIPILFKHKPVSAENHPKELTVGASGTDAVFEFPYLKNSLVIWTKDDIDAIEAETKKELSCGYRYTADMTPGSINGEKYDGVMRNIIFNHISLVREGRAGSDVVVGDSVEHLEQHMKKVKGVTGTGVITACVLDRFLRNRIAKDQALNLSPIIGELSRKSFAKNKEGVLKTLKTELKGKLAPQFGMDATIGEVAELLDVIDAHGAGGAHDDEEPLPDEVTDSMEDMEPEHEPDGEDDDPMGQVEEFLKGKLSEDDHAHCMGLLRGGQDDEPDLEEERDQERMTGGKDKRRGAKDSDKGEFAGSDPEHEGSLKSNFTIGGKDKRRGAKDKRMGRDDPPPFKGKPEVGGGMDEKSVRKIAQDAADTARKEERDAQRALRDAEQRVRPYLGEVSTIAFDSAEELYEAAFEALGVDIDGVPPSIATYQKLLDMVPKPGSKRGNGGSTPPRMAVDESVIGSFEDRFPDTQRIKSMG